MNMCVIDWSSIAIAEYLTIVIPNALLVADYAAKFLKNLTSTYSVPFKNIFLFGHSLGCVVAGNIGKQCGGQIGKIFAADPCGPGCYYEDTHLILSKTSAKYVQIITTNLGGAGRLPTYNDGHQIFLVNMGGPNQCGCNKVDVFCAHLRACDYFVYSLNRANIFAGRYCPNPLLYFAGFCANTPVDDIGIYGNQLLEGLFFLFTSAAPPFAKGPNPPGTADEVLSARYFSALCPITFS